VAEARWGSVRRGARCSAAGGAAGGAMDCIGGSATAATGGLARRRGSFCGACAARPRKCQKGRARWKR
jgi:hypothetical protein